MAPPRTDRAEWAVRQSRDRGRIADYTESRVDPLRQGRRRAAKPWNCNVIPVNDLAEFEWLYQSLRPTPHAGEVTVETGVELSCIIPLQFERFAKILHRLDGHYENIDRPLSRDEMAILNQPGCEVVRDEAVDANRFHVRDPFGNRLEFIEA